MVTKTKLDQAEVDELVKAAQHVVALFGVICDARHNNLRECDSESLTQEGIGFISAFYEPKRALERALDKFRAY